MHTRLIELMQLQFEKSSNTALILFVNQACHRMCYSVGSRFHVKHLMGVLNMMEKILLKTFSLLKSLEKATSSRSAAIALQ